MTWRDESSGRRGTAAAGLLVLLVTAAGATPALAEPLTLDGAVARALTASPALRAARLESLAAEARTNQAWFRHLGELDLVGVASRFEGDRLVKPITGPLNPAAIGGLPFDREQLHLGVTWQVPLFTGGALVEGDRAAGLAARAASTTAQRTLDEVRYAIRAAFRNALGVRHALAAAEAYEAALAQDVASARLKVETEAWSRADGDKVSFALASARSRRAGLEAQRRAALGYLAALMGEPPLAASYELEDVAAAPPPPAPPPEELQARAIAQRPDLQSAHLGAEAQRRRSAAVRAGFWPQLGLTGNYTFNDAPSVGLPLQTWEVTLQVKLPILGDLGRVSAVREADAAAAAATERARAKGLEVEAQVVEALGRLEAARAALAAGEAQRSLGAEVARVEQLRFEAGTGKAEDLLAARAQALEGETAFWLGTYGLQAAQDYLELVSGKGGSRE